MEIRDEILGKLKALETERNITILYACESGSRAWGFPSADSDYDVRFFYVNEPNWYLSIEDRRDVIEDVGKVLDFSGWELRKTLRLFRGSNASLYEKLQSPIVYIDKGGFRKELNSLMEGFHNPTGGLYHYLSLVRNFYEYELSSDEVKLKKYFYAIRSVLAARWIREEGGIPPMKFSVLRKLENSSKWNDLIEEWLVLKTAGTEAFCVGKSDLMNEFILNEVEKGRSYAKSLKSSKKPDSEILNEHFRRWVGHPA